MSSQTTERPAAITFRGNPMTLNGPELHPGDPAPDFTLTAAGLKPFTLSDATAGGTRDALLITVPSLDTPTCSVETSTFHKRLAELPDGVAAFVISADLPFAQARWAEANDAAGLQYLSDYRDRGFAHAYGVAIKELALLARAVFLVGRDGRIAYVQLVSEVATEPDYEAVFAAARDLRK